MGNARPAATNTPPKRPRRKDPSARAVHGTAQWGQLANKEPGRMYVLVNKHDSMAKATYESSGYRFERFRKGGVRPLGWDDDNHEEGEIIEHVGMLLMSCSRERHEEIRRYGHDGEGGQADADRQEKLLRMQQAGYDPMRGIAGFQPGRDYEIKPDEGSDYGRSLFEDE